MNREFHDFSPLTEKKIAELFHVFFPFFFFMKCEIFGIRFYIYVPYKLSILLLCVSGASGD